MAVGRKHQKSHVLEKWLDNLWTVFCLGFLLGFAMAFWSMKPNAIVGALKNHFPVTYIHRAAENSLGDQVRIVQKAASTNLNVARELRNGARDAQGKKLKRRMRILCWVMTAGKSDNKIKALAIKTTWGRHCDKILFFAEVADAEVPTIKIDNVQPGRFGLWTKVVGAFKYIHKHHRDDYDWVLRADDDTFAIIENIREMLLPYSAEQPGYFGFRFIMHAPKGYFSGGGGVLLSKEALDRVVTGAFDNKHRACVNITYSAADDDVKIAQCLFAVGVEPDDSRDFRGRSRMHCFDVEAHLKPDQGPRNWWYWTYLYWSVNGGMECCAENGIAWHYIPAMRQYVLHYLAYTVTVENVVSVARATPPPSGIYRVTPSTTFQPQHTRNP